MTNSIVYAELPESISKEFSLDDNGHKKTVEGLVASSLQSEVEKPLKRLSRLLMMVRVFNISLNSISTNIASSAKEITSTPQTR